MEVTRQRQMSLDGTVRRIDRELRATEVGLERPDTILSLLILPIADDLS